MTIFGTVGISAKAIFLFVFIAALSSCTSNSSKGPNCDYETVETLAEVIDLKPHPDGKGRISVIMDFKASVLALEDQELGDLKGISIDHEFLVRNSIEIHNRYHVMVSELIRGECETKLTVAFDHAFE